MFKGLIQAPDVCWNKPFKTTCRSLYDEWMRVAEKQYTKGGNMKPPSKAMMVQWVKKAWDSLEEMIRKSFKVCGITNIDGTEDKEIGVMKEGGIAHNAIEELAKKTKMLVEQRGDLKGILNNPLRNSDEVDGGDSDIAVDDDSSDSSDTDSNEHNDEKKIRNASDTDGNDVNNDVNNTPKAHRNIFDLFVAKY